MDKTVDHPHMTYPIVKAIQQSPPVDTETSYEASWVNGKTILITGGASGFGAGFARRWANNGANVVIGDIAVGQSEQLVQEIKKESGNDNIHFIYCNVCDWDSQVNFFKEAVKISPHGGIDAVVANAGIAGTDGFEMPINLDISAPPKPNLKTIEVNLIGLLYTTHLALFWLPRNPESQPCFKNTEPATATRDRHLLLMGSMASLGPIPGQTLYGASKHGVLGVFRNLRATCFIHGIRVSLVCPYFIDTPILPAPARAILAGGGLGKPEDVVEAGTRLMADNRIIGRSLYVGPKMDVVQGPGGDWQLAVNGKGMRRAIWEAYAHDFEDSELFGRNLTRLLNALTRIRGWRGYLVDMIRAIIFGIRAGPRVFFGKNRR